MLAYIMLNYTPNSCVTDVRLFRVCFLLLGSNMFHVMCYSLKAQQSN